VQSDLGEDQAMLVGTVRRFVAISAPKHGAACKASVPFGRPGGH
jgi:hypothetical protein